METSNLANPIQLVCNNDNILAKRDFNETVLLNDPEGKAVDFEKVRRSIALIKSDFEMQIVSLEDTADIVCDSLGRNAQASFYYMLNTSTTYRQGSTSWCAAYAASAIFSYIGASGANDPSALMREAYPGFPAGTRPYGRSEMLNAATKRSSSLTYTGTLSTSSIAANLSISAPIFAEGQRSTGRHAFVINGVSGEIIRYWNPWYSEYQTTFGSLSTVYFSPKSGDSWKWESSYTGWKVR